MGGRNSLTEKADVNSLTDLFTTGNGNMAKLRGKE